MRKSLLSVATAGLLIVSSLLPAAAANNFTPVPGREAPKPNVVEKLRLAQAVGYICRNGQFWCRPGGWGYVGQNCCCPAYNFCGWVSDW